VFDEKLQAQDDGEQRGLVRLGTECYSRTIFSA
jgi:hypothetical protein